MGSNAREFIEWYRTGKVKSREDILHQHKEEDKPEHKVPEYYKPTEQEKRTIIDFATIDEPASSIAKFMLLPLDVVQKVIDEAFQHAKVAESRRQLRRS